jgi:hypothetical protein
MTPGRKTAGPALCAALLTFVFSCTTTIRKFKPPGYAIAPDSLQAQINRIVSCQTIHLDGAEIITNGKSSSELEIDIINGNGVPGDSSQMKTLGHAIAADVKKALQESDEYDTYRVLFVKVESVEGMVKRTWRGNTFRSSEL